MKRYFAVIVCINFICNVFSQNVANGYWIPLKRFDQIILHNRDSCSEVSEFPFKKIKFLQKDKVSLFGFNISDPFIYDIKKLENKSEWYVIDSVIVALSPKYVFGSKVFLKIRNDSLSTTVINGKDTLIQKFVRHYAGINLTNYSETEIGNLLIKGKYRFKNQASIDFFSNGKITTNSTADKKIWKYQRFRFKNYLQQCRTDYFIHRIIELFDQNNKKELFLIKDSKEGYEFHRIKKMKDPWTAAEYEFSFSLTRLK